MADTTSVSARLPDDLLDELDAEVERRGLTSRSALLRIAIGEILGHKEDDPEVHPQRAVDLGLQRTFHGQPAVSTRPLRRSPTTVAKVQTAPVKVRMDGGPEGESLHRPPL